SLEGNAFARCYGIEEFYVPNSNIGNIVFNLGEVKNNQIFIGKPGNAEVASKSDFIYHIDNLGRDFDEDG
ncbi:hypothetical protein Q604_UNBC16456G0001, partial [human gut metagenome]